MCSIFEVYAMLRKNGAIGPIRVVQVKPGTFARLKKLRCPLVDSVQYKVPRVLRDPVCVEFLISQALVSTIKGDTVTFE